MDLTSSSRPRQVEPAEKRPPASAVTSAVASVVASIAATGALALAAQVLLLRELLTAWRGNEMSFGVALAVWLAAGGAGSAGYGLLARSWKPGRSALAWSVLALGALVPVSLVVARMTKTSLGMSAGELHGVGPLVLASLAALVPFTLLAGFLFALATSVMSRGPGGPAAAGGRVYLVEACGAAGGGAAMSFLLLPNMGPVAIAGCMTLVACAASAWLTLSEGRHLHRRSARARLSTAILAGGGAALLLGPVGTALDDASVRAQWRELGFVSQENSVYGRIVATADGSQLALYESGILAASYPDRLSAEETVHLPLLLHPSPARVLLLGGGLGGAVEEVLKHPSVERVDYVELDPALVRVAGAEFEGALAAGLSDPRVRVHAADARFFAKRARPGYDVVIVGAPDPSTAQLNRFYTAEFMGELRRILTEDGLAGFRVRSAENYVGGELAEFLACVGATARVAFPHVMMFPGDPCHIVAARSGEYLTRDPSEIAARVSARGLDVVHVRDYYLADRFSPDRREQFDEALSGIDGHVNEDLHPVAYYLSSVLWNRQLSGAPDFFERAASLVGWRITLLLAAALVVVLGVPALAGRGSPERHVGRTLTAAVLIVGATEISLELTALLAFQSLYGYVYHQLAAIVAAFMAGLALGGWLGTAAVRRGAGLRALALLQALITLVPLALLAALAGISRLPAERMELWAALFPLVVVASAVLAGTQFPVAARLVSSDRDVATAAGRLYGADLAGAAIGAPVTAVLLLPVAGTAGSMGVFAVVNAAVFAALLAALVSRARRAAQ